MKFPFHLVALYQSQSQLGGLDSNVHVGFQSVTSPVSVSDDVMRSEIWKQT